MAKKKPIAVFGRDGLLVFRCSAKGQPATPSCAACHHQLLMIRAFMGGSISVISANVNGYQRNLELIKERQD